MSALFSHNRAHFREQEQFSCSFPGCNKQYDKACRLKIHMRSHTGTHEGVFQGRAHRGWAVNSGVWCAGMAERQRGGRDGVGCHVLAAVLGFPGFMTLQLKKCHFD